MEIFLAFGWCKDFDGICDGAEQVWSGLWFRLSQWDFVSGERRFGSVAAGGGHAKA